MTTILNYLVSFGNNILRGKSGSIFSANFMEHDHINTAEKTSSDSALESSASENYTLHSSHLCDLSLHRLMFY